MKKFLMFASVALIVASCSAQEKKKSPHETVSNENVEVTYGRPYKKDRVIFGGLVKYGEVWRTGADEATVITFKKDGTFGGQPVKAGSYALFTIPGEKQWTIILNSVNKTWGAYDYDKNKDKDVLKVTVPATSTPTLVEQFTIIPKSTELILNWDKTEVVVPYSF